MDAAVVVASASMLHQKKDLIAELKISKDLDGIKKEQVKSKQQVQQKVAQIVHSFRAENFLDRVPETDPIGATIPAWKRLMMAKKVAEKAKKDAEQQVMLEAEAKRLHYLPAWKRNILNRRSDHKSASPA